MYHSPKYRLIIPALIGIASLVLIASGVLAVTYKVYDEAPEDFDDPFLLFEKISDAGMTIESTYGGVKTTDDGAFYFSYDRTAAAVGIKPPCET